MKVFINQTQMFCVAKRNSIAKTKLQINLIREINL